MIKENFEKKIFFDLFSRKDLQKKKWFKKIRSCQNSHHNKDKTI